MGKNNQNIIIAGPCAIETKKVFFDTLESINEYVDVFRAGVWKARTSPKNYKGIGIQGIEWINQAQKKYNKPFAIEVGSAKHVEIALNNNIRILWIGARTTCNPFSVQEICEATKGENVEIWIKNPMFSSVELWIGAIERFEESKTQKIKIIHRGFYTENTGQYRNLPRWDIVKKIREKYLEIPVICDPSHMAGNTHLIQDICLDALNHNIHGFMIEVHQNPEIALSDKGQQLDPKSFYRLMQKLNLTKPS